MPREIELKWFRKLKLATESTTTKGTHVLIELRTKGYPASTKRKQADDSAQNKCNDLAFAQRRHT